MAYCTIDDLKIYVPKLEFSASTKPTSTQVESIITNTSYEIDSALQTAGYSLPVTDADTLAFLKNLNALGAAAIAEGATLPEKVGDTHDSKLLRLYEKRLDNIKNKKLLPVDISTNADAKSATHSTDDTTLDVDPQFESDMKF